MSNNYEDYGYEDNDTEVTNEGKSPIAKKLLIIMLVIIAVLLILYLVKGCTGKNDKDKDGDITKPVSDYEEMLLKAGKEYFNYNRNSLPTTVGECSEVKLEILIDKGLVNPSKFEKCNNTASFVRACVLSNGSMQYTPWFVCSDKKSEDEYAESKPGTLADIKADKTYVSFKFLPQMLKSNGEFELGNVEELWKSEIKHDKYKTLSTVNHYRFRDKLYTWDLTTNYYYTPNGEKTNEKDVKEYYTSAPTGEHKMYSNGTNDAYKWYKASYAKEYYKKNGSNFPWPVSPDDYKEYTYNEDIIPGTATYAYIKGKQEGDAYTALKYYGCAVDKTSSTIVYQRNTECGKGTNKSFTVQREIIYSCANDAMMPVLKYKTTEGAMCTKYKWDKLSGSETCDPSKADCYKLRMYNWYKLVESGRSYYPSGATTSAGEKTYYTSSPASEYIKDTASKTKAYKWYRDETKTSTEYTALAPSGYSKAAKTNNYKYTDWSDWTTKSVKASDSREREIETKTKVKLQQILDSNESSWENLTQNDEYVTLEEMIDIFRNNKFEVESLTDINNRGEIRYQIQMFVRNKKEAINNGHTK